MGHSKPGPGVAGNHPPYGGSYVCCFQSIISEIRVAHKAGSSITRERRVRSKTYCLKSPFPEQLVGSLRSNGVSISKTGSIQWLCVKCSVIIPH